MTKKKALTKHPVVVIDWDDSFSWGMGWGPTPEGDHPQGSHITSVGYLICKTKKFTTIIQSLDLSTEGTQGYAPFSIPNKTIRKMSTLKT